VIPVMRPPIASIYAIPFTALAVTVGTLVEAQGRTPSWMTKVTALVQHPVPEQGVEVSGGVTKRIGEGAMSGSLSESTLPDRSGAAGELKKAPRGLAGAATRAASRRLREVGLHAAGNDGVASPTSTYAHLAAEDPPPAFGMESAEIIFAFSVVATIVGVPALTWTESCIRCRFVGVGLCRQSTYFPSRRPRISAPHRARRFGRPRH